MLVEIIRELTKCDENTNIHNESVLTWAKRVEAQRVQTVVNSSLHETKSFDAIVKKRCQAHRQKTHNKIIHHLKKM